MKDEIVSESTISENTEQIDTGYSRMENKDTRFALDYDDWMWDIKAKLLGGWVIQNKKGSYVIVRPKGARPLMNPTGIEETMAIINGFVSKIQALSILDEERIYDMCRVISTELSQAYYLNMENYGLNPIRATLIRSMLMNLIETNLRKSIMGTMLKMMIQTERITEIKQDNTKKKGIWPFAILSVIVGSYYLQQLLNGGINYLSL